MIIENYFKKVTRLHMLTFVDLHIKNLSLALFYTTAIIRGSWQMLTTWISTQHVIHWLTH